MTTKNPEIKHSHSDFRLKILTAVVLLTSFGILLVTVGGSWDITNHLLNKPETFFSPPHGLLYLGVGLAVIGTGIAFIISKKFLIKKPLLVFPLKLMILGIFLLLGAGPFDFLWHSTFGLDGLFSPPHLCLIAGMILCSIGSLVCFRRLIPNFKNSKSISFLLVLSILPVWLSTSGLFYSFLLPFSDTEFFKFNPDPNFAVIFAITSFPFLISFSLLLVSKISNYSFGVLSLSGIFFIIINWATSIAQNPSLSNTTEFYFLNIIPIICADGIITLYKKQFKVFYIVGGLLGSIFYFVYFPLITHTFNEIFSKQIVWASLTSKIYFSMLPEVYLLAIIPSILSGIIGALLSQRIGNKIMC